jgi:hypothetical protein
VSNRVFAASIEVGGGTARVGPRGPQRHRLAIARNPCICCPPFHNQDMSIPPDDVAARTPAPPKAQETLSQLVAKILDQLSISAWLPAAVLVAMMVLSWSIWTAHSRAPHSGVEQVVREAVSDIGGMEVGSFLLLVAGVVLVTTLTQAFAFAAIRLFEGYWRPGRLIGRLADWRCRHHRRKRAALEEAEAILTRSALAGARQRMLEEGISRLTVDILESQRIGSPVDGASETDVEKASEVDWRVFANPNEILRLEGLNRHLLDYPQDDYRILPTRLGNVIRSFEDRIDDSSGEDLEGWVQRQFHDLPEVIKVEHDQHRNRLDLYSSMVVTFAFVGGANALLFWKLGMGFVVAASLVALCLAVISYQAAIASARGYGSVLATIHELYGTRSKV